MTHVVPLQAADYTWTNTASDASDYWTNGVFWGNLPGNYPGSSANTPNAWLTNDVAIGGAYTNVLNAGFTAAISSLVISNGNGGEAWLVVSNGFVNPTILTNSTFKLGNGGRLQIDNGGVVTGITSLAWAGTNGAVYLDNGGKLFTATAVTFGGGAGGVTGLVTSVSGNGGAWDLNNRALNMNGGTAGNLISIAGGVTVTNAGSITITGNQNSLIMTGGSKIFGAGSISFSSTAGQFGNTIMMGAGTWDLQNNPLMVGGWNYFSPAVNNASNNTFISLGTTVTNASGLIVGGFWGDNAVGDNYNKVVFTNGGGFFMTAPGMFFVGAGRTIQSGGGNNTVILSNSVISSSQGTGIGLGSSNNIVTFLANSVWDNNHLALELGESIGGAANSNILTINGALATNFSTIAVGDGAGSSGNQLLIENGGILSNFTSLSVGTGAHGDNNSLIVTNGGRLVQNIGGFTVGNGSGNTVILSNSLLNVNSTSVTIGTGSTNNTVTLLADTVWKNTGASGSLTIGTGMAVSNSLVVSGGTITNVTGLYVGVSPGANDNRFVVTNGGHFYMVNNNDTVGIDVGATAGGGTGGGNNSVIISNGLLIDRNSDDFIGAGSSNNTMTLLDTAWNNGAFSASSITIGKTAGTGNLLTLDDSVLTNVNSLTIGTGAGNVDFGNAMILTNGSRLSTDAINIGAGGSSNNILSVAGGAGGSVVSNFGGATIGAVGSSFNTLALNNTLLYMNGALAIGGGAGAFSNQVLVNNGSSITNVSGLTVGSGSGADFNSLIITSGAGFFLKSGALSIGALGGNNTVVLSNSLLTSTTTPTFGSGSSNNTFTLLAGSVWNASSAIFTLGSGAAYDNVLAVDGGVVSNFNAPGAVWNTLFIGGSAGSISNQLIVRNGGVVSNVSGLVVGGVSGASYNSLIVTNGGRFIMKDAGYNSDVLVGASDTSGSAIIGGGNNTMILSNSYLETRNYLNLVGYGSSNNTVTLLANTIWNAGWQAAAPLVIGGGAVGAGAALASAGVSNGVIFSGGVLSNDSYIVVGDGAGNVNYGNYLVVTNGGRIVVGGGGITIGTGGSASNSFRMDGGRQALAASTLVTNFGVLTIGAAGSGYNSLTLSNARLFVSAASTVGNGSSNNSAAVYDNGTWTMGAVALTVGTGAATGNVLRINGGNLTNVTTLTVGATAGANGNSVLVGKGGILTANAVVLGSGTANQLIVDSGTVAVGGLTIDAGNQAMVTNHGNLFIGSGGLTSSGTLVLGGGGVLGANAALSITVPVTLTNGIAIFQAAAQNGAAENITLSGGLSGPGGFAKTGGGSLTLSGVNLFSGATIVSNGLLTVSGNFVLSPNSALTVASGATFTDNFQQTVGSIAGAGSIVLGAGGVLSNGFDNTSSVYSGVISGNGALTKYGTGTLTLSGTETYSGPTLVSNGTVKVSGVMAGTGMVTIGDNGTLTGSGIVSSQVINAGIVAANSPAPLQLLGSEPFINQSGGFVKGNNGGLIVSGTFTNSGTLQFVNSAGTFNSAVVNNGTWISDPSTFIFNSTFSNGPTGFIISTNDTYVFKSNFVNQSTQKLAYNTGDGKFVFAGTGSTQTMQVAGLSLGGYGSTIMDGATNPVYFTANGVTVSTNLFAFNPRPLDPIWGFTNNFALGTLEISNTTLELGQAVDDPSLTNGLYVHDLLLDPGGYLIISNNVQLYFTSTNDVTGLAYGDWANNPGANVLLLNGAGFHELLVPEPSILMLWVLGLTAVYFARRRKRASVG